MYKYALSPSGLYLPHQDQDDDSTEPHRMYFINTPFAGFLLHDIKPPDKLEKTITVEGTAIRIRAVLQCGNVIRHISYYEFISDDVEKEQEQILIDYKNDCDCERMLNLFYYFDGPLEFDEVEVDYPDTICSDGMVSVLSLKVNGCEMLTDGPI